MANDKGVQILLPTGRMVWGDLYVPKTTDQQGQPLVVKTSPNRGQPRKDYPIGVAIPKGPEAMKGPYGWTETPWGAQILAVAQQSFPQAIARADFAWKVVDGDSTAVNKNNRVINQTTGYAGHWVLRLGSGFAPRIVDDKGAREITDVNFVVPGYFVQVYISVSGNGQDLTPGLYLNHLIVSFQGYGERIVSGPDAAAVGFGQGALPAGASATPIGGMMPAAAAAQVGGLPGLPAPGAMPHMPVPGFAGGMPGAAMPAPGLPQLPVAQPAAPVVVQPNPAFTQIPGMPAAQPFPAGAQPMVPAALPAAAQAAMPIPGLPAPAAVPQYRMTPKASGYTREQFLVTGQGWTDERLLAEGYMTL